MMCSSEEEGYEYHASDDREKRRDRVSDTFGETVSKTAMKTNIRARIIARIESKNAVIFQISPRLDCIICHKHIDKFYKNLRR